MIPWAKPAYPIAVADRFVGGGRNDESGDCAAIELTGGKLIGTCLPSYRHQQWIKFLKLIDAIMAFFKEHNDDPQSFASTAKAEEILAKVRRAQEVLDKTPSA